MALHFGADLMSRAMREPIWEQERRGDQTIKVSKRSNDLAEFMGDRISAHGDSYVLRKEEDREITKDALGAYEAGATWDDYQSSR